MEEIGFGDWKKLKMKVGKIIKVERILRTEKLYKIQVDIEMDKSIHIVSALVPYYTKKELENPKILVLVNIKPAKFQVLNLLKDSGCEVDFDQKIALAPQNMVKDCISKGPSIIKLYSQDGKRDLSIGSNRTFFNPGSAAIYLIDHKTEEIRKPLSKDLIDFVRVADVLDYIHGKSTALISSDVPEEICHLYRLYLVVKNSPKTIITGAFSKQGLLYMKRILEVIACRKDELRSKPMAIFHVCLSSPLLWSVTTYQNLIDCAKFEIPAEIIPALQLGAVDPETLAGDIVQINAEFLSGLVISKLTSPGAPTYAYLGLSDSKVVDSQSGLESNIGLIFGVLASINVISGPGMLVLENWQSFEKLIINKEICETALRLGKGVTVNDDTLALEVISKVAPGGHFLAEKHIREWIRKERLIPPEIIDRLTLEAWWRKESKNIIARAHKIVDKILEKHVPEPLLPDIKKFDVSAWRDFEALQDQIGPNTLKPQG